VREGLRPNLTPSFASARPPSGALGDAAAFELRGNAKHGKDKLGEIARGIKHRLGNRPQARPGTLHVTGDHQKVVVSRDRRSTAGIITTSPEAKAGISFLSCGRSAVVPLIFSRNTLFASRRLELGKLAGEVLGNGRNAGIAVNHARNCASEICIKKRNRISALVLNRKSSSFAPPTASPDSYPHSMAM